MCPERQAQQALLQILVRSQFGHGTPRCTTRPLSITATVSPRALAIMKFCSTSRIVVFWRLSSPKASMRLRMIDGARPLLGSSMRISARGSTMARATASICFCPPLSLPAGYSQNFFSAGNRPKIQSSRCVSSSPAWRARRAASTMFSLTVRSVKMPMLSGT